MKNYRIILSDEKCRAKLKQGIDAVCSIIANTLGPYGQNVAINDKGKTPVIINDGFRIAQQIILKDETEDLGAQIVIDVANKTNEMVGDGTTTSMVLAQAIVDKVFKQMEEKKLLLDKGGNSGMEIRRQILASCERVVEALKKSAKQIKTQEDIERVAITALEDEKLGKIVADMIQKVGKDGFISVEDGYTFETKTDVISGMKFLGKYMSEFLITKPERKEAIMTEPYIFITNHDFQTQTEIKQVLDIMVEKGKKELVIITGEYAKEIEPMLAFNKFKGVFYCLAIKSPGRTTEELEDMAVYTGANFFDKQKGMELANVKFEDFGRAKKIVVDTEHTFIIEGKGSPSVIKNRVIQLKAQMKETEKTDIFKKRMARRIASLSGGVGLIEVAAKSDVERNYLREKVDDSVYACKAAMEEGIVSGGGLALKEIAKTLPDEDILKDVITAPYDQIQANSGGKLTIGKNIIDPLKVVRVALENACSFAGTFITTNSSIAWKKHTLEGEVREVVNDKSFLLDRGDDE